MSELCPYVDICIANEDDAVGIFSMDASKSDKEKNAYIAEELTKRFPFKMVASHSIKFLLVGSLSKKGVSLFCAVQYTFCCNG